jgi:hypothetical protein
MNVLWHDYIGEEEEVVVMTEGVQSVDKAGAT